VVGSTLGLLLGVVLSQRLVRLVARAVSDLYFAVTVTDVPLPMAALGRGWLLGIAVAVAASWPAARDATSTEPHVALQRSALESRVRRGLPRLTLAALATIAASLLLLRFSGQGIGLAMVALVLLLVGGAGLVPGAVLLGARLCGAGLAALLGPTGRLAARGIAAGLSRTGVATAALALALAVATGMGVMVLSFRHAVETWLEGTLRADVYVSAPTTVSARAETPLPPALVQRLPAIAGVAEVGTSRTVTVDSGGTPTLLMALALPADRRPGFQLLNDADEGEVWPAFRKRGAVLVSEPLAFKRHLRPGDTLTVATDRGPVPFPVAAVYRDYGSDAGVIAMSDATYRRHYDDRQVTAVALLAAPDVTAEQLVARVRAQLGADDAVLVRSNKTLRETSLVIFDRTFEITGVLRLFALIVAAFGVASALMAVALERGRERATLRALGATPGQVVQITLLETGLLGTLAGVLAMPLGAALAAVLVFVINQRSFGWTMPLQLAPRALLLAPLLGLASGLAAGLYPAWRAGRVVPAQALREE
jgi:putative ABC transport system permease protein